MIALHVAESLTASHFSTSPLYSFRSYAESRPIVIHRIPTHCMDTLCLFPAAFHAVNPSLDLPKGFVLVPLLRSHDLLVWAI
jgi:hypothetical protein